MSLRLSIIIPAYKVEDYIEKCIRSLEDQDIPKTEYEIIVTNDGSPDRCKEIVESLQKEFSNIVLVDQENQGVSMARNNAITIAKGKYILPIDPDDYIVPNTLGCILKIAETKDLEVMYLGFEIFDSHNVSIWSTDYSQQEKRLFSGTEGYYAARGHGVKDPDRSAGMLFCMSLLKKYEITYPKGVPFLEDGLFIGKVLSVSSRVGFDNNRFYQRTTRLGSATNSKLFYSESSKIGFKKAILDLKEFELQLKKENRPLELLNHLHAKFLLHLLAPSASCLDYKTFKKVTTLIEKEDLSLKSKIGLGKVNRKLISIFSFSKWLFFLFYPLYIRKRNRTSSRL
jgi:glycosyltransferase involved in cell wall biosynthesis